MKLVLFIFAISSLFSSTETDSLKNSSIFSKKLNIPGIISNNMSRKNELVLLPTEVEAIKQKAKDYIPEPVSPDDVVIMETSRGIMKINLFSEIAPKHCYNFKKLANSGFYDHTSFHRIIPDFMIQGGDINSRDSDPSNDGHGGPGWTIDAEFNNTPHLRGTLSMARASDPNSAGSQFFICVVDAPHLDGDYTVFGEVIDRVHIVDHIVKTPTEYERVKRLSKESIPNGEDPENWISLKDPKTKKKIYLKVPQYKKRSDFEYEMRMKIKSDRPALRVEIEKVRVVSKSEIENKK